MGGGEPVIPIEKAIEALWEQTKVYSFSAKARNQSRHAEHFDFTGARLWQRPANAEVIV
jgi:hypothetical protein